MAVTVATSGGDLFGRLGQAQGYAAHRPRYPEELLNLLWKRTEANATFAVDACCGSGQLTTALAAHFEKVLGLDCSDEQLLRADKGVKNAEYRKADCTSLEGVPDGAVDFVTIAQALHWLNTSAFFSAADRVLRPGGYFAILGYGICSLEDPEAEKIFKAYYYNTMGTDLPLGDAKNFWDCDRKFLDNGYSGCDLTPFEDEERHWYHDSKTMKLDDFMGYLKTWSAYRTYLERVGSDPLPAFRENLKAVAGGSEDCSFKVKFPYFLILTKKALQQCCTSALTTESSLTPGVSSSAQKEADGEEHEAPVAVNKAHYPSGLNANFLLGDTGEIVETHIEKFEDPERRDIARAAPDIVEMLRSSAGLTSTSTVADIGAGTGLLLSRLSEAASTVTAVEISPAFLAYLRKQVKVKRLQNVSVVEGTGDDPCLPKRSIDLALVCDVYHHFEYPITTCRRIGEALRPGGRLVVIDFIRDEAIHKSHPPGWITDHVRAGQDVFREEILSAGFRLVSEPQIPSLVENYCMIFESSITERAS
eukprot:TRINITY_DN67763_c0_g1_i1.p1 TRINITY_DN67763_c0_g1~~TRINITY_DN67763_c0_g1_i1.p1  ORF type:complete len:533 (-),score=93.09 TRINITY_DN67763_c0_g1_i1:59-1657(-)